MRVPIPRAPDILTPWRAQILATLAEAGIAADVGPKRPASTTNLEGRFVRIMCLGGAWDARVEAYLAKRRPVELHRPGHPVLLVSVITVPFGQGADSPTCSQRRPSTVHSS